MFNIYRKNKILIIIVVIALVSNVFGLTSAVKNDDFTLEKTSNLIYFEQNFSEPDITKTQEYIKIEVPEANSHTFLQGSTNMPVFRTTYELFWDTNIIDINFSHSEIQIINLSSNMKNIPLFKNNIYEKNNIYTNIKNTVSENNNSFFPENWYTVEKNAGLNKQGNRTFFLTLNIYPARYNKGTGILEFITKAVFEIKYEESNIEFADPGIYDLVIISPDIFKENLTSLVNHKKSYGIKTNLTTLEDIYSRFPGRDNAEQIKYFIKDTIEEWGTKYVLLVGEMRILPIRQTDAYPWEGYHGEGILSDLYYADIYNSDYNFSSWDTNEDEIFGQIKYNWSWGNIKVEIVDEVDLYPDLHVGRLACRNTNEVDLLVKRIIDYETQTYAKDWFKRIILAGGNTFPSAGGGQTVLEGEITNSQVAEELPDFEHVKLWASKRNLNAFTFNRAINKGAGFLTYAGHGFEHGWGTYKVNALSRKISFTDPLYYTPFLQFLNNKEKLPIIFFDACLTAKLDFWIGDLAEYYPVIDKIINLMGVEPNKNNHLPCFAWCFMIQKNGGAIATIGATRPAYSLVDIEGVHAGAGYLDWMFFKNYYEGVRLGEMLTNAQIDYIQNRFMDYFTIEQYILLGDPSLMVGGYPLN